ncbi:hypothetical protein F8388_005091 [Cannabis sativa]|uniref:Ubiquitin-like protease family profile domain-containing protein n=1 Tax=Cannabis sativa TaxID=3483 RepID=A0A7J6E073_CANSA|nr:hypothetical protein F8388_005091 [Cannabis sativa]
MRKGKRGYGKEKIEREKERANGSGEGLGASAPTRSWVRMSSSEFESPKKTSKNTQSPSSTRSVKRKCIGKTSKWNKVPQYMISQTKRFGTKVQPFNDLSDLKVQAQLVHHHHVERGLFDINGTMVRFSIEKFSLITGLKCHGNDDESIFVEKDESLKKVLFKESKGLITKKEVRNAFIRKRAKGDVNMVKLGLVHFLANFLFGTVPETKVSNFFWNIVDSDDATFQQFPYGKLLWEKSRHSMRLSLMKKEEIFEKMFDEETGNIQPYSYKLFGFPYAFLIWIFETIPALSPTFCEKLEVVQLLPKESEKESETLKEFSFQPKFMFREAPQTDVQPLTEIPILRPIVRTTYESYLADGSNVINQETIIAKYMSGQSLSCSVSWYYLDHVAIPGHVTDEVHYILAHFNIRERCLVVYNSMIPKVNKKPVEKTVTTFSVLIHLFMECIGFYNTRAGIDFNQGPYAVARSHPLAVNDCGAFVIAFADHIIHDTINGISPKLNIANYRDDLAVCLYHHAKKKQEDGYKTDVEEPEKPEKMKKKTDVEEPEKPEKEKKKTDAEAPEKTEKKKKKDVEEAPRKPEKKKRKVVQEAPEKPEKKKIIESLINIHLSKRTNILLIFVIGGGRSMNNEMKNDNHTRGEGKKSDENRKKPENSIELLCRT